MEERVCSGAEQRTIIDKIWHTYTRERTFTHAQTHVRTHAHTYVHTDVCTHTQTESNLCACAHLLTCLFCRFPSLTFWMVSVGKRSYRKIISDRRLNQHHLEYAGPANILIIFNVITADDVNSNIGAQLDVECPSTRSLDTKPSPTLTQLTFRSCSFARSRCDGVQMLMHRLWLQY